jgi:hypothetical protein
VKRRTLDLVFSAGGVGLAGLLFLIGVVLTTNANFADDYVSDQLRAQKITFKAADLLTPEERESECVRRYAGQLLSTGKQAECYANDFIGLHVASTADGRTYAELGDVQTGLRSQVAAAQRGNDPALADLQRQLQEVTAQRETLFKGETLRGLLLTSYGFSVFGTKAEQVATVAYVSAALMLVLSAAGFAHALLARGGRRSSGGEPPGSAKERSRPAAV